MTHNRGFSLIELSIALVIIAALVGGVVIGQSMIRTAELRAIPTEYALWAGALKTFRDQYNYYPGDFPAATSIWGDDNTYCADAAITNGVPGTCNGNGDAQVTTAVSGSVTGESFEFWRQLSLAGFIPGRFNGLAGSTNGSHAILGTNTPASKVRDAGWAFAWRGPVSVSNAVLFGVDYGNAFTFGNVRVVSGTTYSPSIYALTPAEAFAVDRKLDDGIPSAGFVVVFGDWGSGAAASEICSVVNSGSAAYNNLDTSYNVTNKSLACGLNFVKQ